MTEFLRIGIELTRTASRRARGARTAPRPPSQSPGEFPPPAPLLDKALRSSPSIAHSPWTIAYTPLTKKRGPWPIAHRPSGALRGLIMGPRGGGGTGESGWDSRTELEDGRSGEYRVREGRGGPPGPGGRKPAGAEGAIERSARP